MNGWDPRDVIKLVTDKFDFMLRYKTTGGSKVYIGDREVSKTVRYYVSTRGEKMRKVAPPKGPLGEYKRKNKITDALFNKVMSEIGPGVWDDRIHTKNKSKYTEVVTGIEAGRLIKECNDSDNFDWSDVDWDYYIKEIEKLKVGSNV